MNFFRILFLPITAPITFIQENFKTVLLLVIIAAIVISNKEQKLETANLQVINLAGPIFSADKIIEQIDKAKTSKNIKGVLLNVNSPGGAVAPSVEIAYAIKELASIKPVVAYASGIMASGSYYSSIYANKIVANPGSMIGSIGVIIQSVDTSELMSKLGVSMQTAKMGKYKEVGTPTRAWNDAEKEELNKVIKSTYEMFVSDVVNARKLKFDDYKNFADAHIFTAIQAKNVGLVDEVATLTTAKVELMKLANIHKAVWQEDDKLDKFMEKVLNSTLSNIFLASENYSFRF